MRLVFTCIPATGRFNIVAPLARAALDAGHEVRVLTSPDFSPEVTRAGFETIPAAPSLAELASEAERCVAGFATLPVDKRALSMFAIVAPRLGFSRARPALSQWKPDLVLHEEGEFAGPLLARALESKSVAIGWPGPMRQPQELQRLDSFLAKAWLDAGFSANPVRKMLSGTFIDSCPPGLQSEGARTLRNAVPMRAVSAPLSERAPATCKPVVYVTLGTVPAYNSAHDIFRTIAEALAGEDLDVIMTIGLNNEPESIGPLHRNIRVEKYIAQNELLLRCGLVICHGGSGSVVGALAHGVPLLLIPLGAASQVRNARACARAGVGLVLERTALDPEAIRDRVRTLLAEPQYAAAARRIAREIQLMPPPSATVRALEQLA